MKKYNSLFILIVFVVLFFLATASFNYFTQDSSYTKWTSPDETANYFFAKQFALHTNLSVFDQAIIRGNNMVLPRSFRNDWGYLKPVSFLGIILLYGGIAKVTTVFLIPFLTPLLAALGIFVFYYLIKKIFDKRVALLSSILLSTFPVYIYYSARSMFHNVLFVDLLIFAFFFFSRLSKSKKEKFLSFRFDKETLKQFIFSLLGGIFLGLAIITRTSELLWLGPVLIVLYLLYARMIGIQKLLLILAGIGIALMPVIYWNQILYTSPIHGGYNAMNRSLDDISQSSKGIVGSIYQGNFSTVYTYIDNIKNNIFYFGFKKDQSISMFQHYVVEMFPFLFYLSIIGIIFLVIQNLYRYKKKHVAYLLSLFILSIILVFYYGSWKFNDNPNVNHYTIGNSYTRYWLPIYLMLIPLASLVIVRVSRALVLMKKKGNKKIQKIISTGIQVTAVSFLAIHSLFFVLYGSEEGLIYLYYNNKLERVKTEKVLSITESNSIIITQYYDKFLFPERRVIVGTFPNEEIFSACDNLIKFYPVYYYNFFLQEKDVEYLNNHKLDKHDFKLKLVKKIGTNFGLYQLIQKNDK